MRRITFSEGEYYHIYNRGVDKRDVFTSPHEYRRFQYALALLNDCDTSQVSHMLRKAEVNLLREHYSEAKPLNNARGRKSLRIHRGDSREPLVAIGAYCLMPNHFHLYVTPLVENGISRFMQRLQTSYTMYFNEQHERSGALFQGTFKAQHVDRNAYARYLFSYIHLNPAKLKDPKWKERGARDLRALRTYVREYPYSSLGEYLGDRRVITDPTRFPAYLSDASDVDEHIDVWLSTREDFSEV